MKRIIADFAARGDSCSVIPFYWSGANTFGGRKDAGSALAKFALNVRLNNAAYEELYLVAHSHGGSVVAYAAGAQPQLKDLVTGVVTLSTPWFVVRAERFSLENRLLAARSLSLILLCGFLFLLTYLAVLAIHGPVAPISDEDQTTFWSALNAFVLALAIAIPIGALVGQVWSILDGLLIRSLLRTKEQFQHSITQHVGAMTTAKLAMPATVVLVASSDEASSTLRVAQWLNAIEREIIGRIAMSAWQVQRLFVRIPNPLRLFVRLLLFIAFSISAIWIGLFAVLMLDGIEAFIFACTNAILILVAGAVGSSILAGVSFGSYNLFAQLNCRFGVEAAPFGPVMFVTVDTSTRVDQEKSPIGVVLNHSAIYLFEEGIVATCEALRRLQRASRSRGLLES